MLPPPIGRPASYECLSGQDVPAGAPACTREQGWQCAAGSRCFLTNGGTDVCLRDCTVGGRCTPGQLQSGAAGASQLDDLCARRAAAACELVARCHTPLLRTSVDACVSAETSQCLRSRADVRAAVLAGRAGVDAARRDGCLAAIAAARCGSDATAVDSACADVTAGLVPAGGSCFADAECVQAACDLSACPGRCIARVAGDSCGTPGQPPCADGLYCDAATSRCVPRRAAGACRAGGECAEAFTCAGAVCVACGDAGQACCGQPRCHAGLDCVGGACHAAGAAGSACDVRATRSCAPALACLVSDPSALSGTCGTPLAAGAPCWFGWSCARGLACTGANPSGGVQGRCAAPVATGGSCRPPGGEATGDCAAGSYCNGTCHAYAMQGASCGPAGSLCAEGLFCVNGATGARCGGLPGNGQPCLAPAFCADGLWCGPGGLCTPYRTAGAACTANTQCASTVCDHATCTRLMQDGESCVGALQCTSQLCADGACRTPCRP